MMMKLRRLFGEVVMTVLFVCVGILLLFTVVLPFSFTFGADLHDWVVHWSEGLLPDAPKSGAGE